MALFGLTDFEWGLLANDSYRRYEFRKDIDNNGTLDPEQGYSRTTVQSENWRRYPGKNDDIDGIWKPTLPTNWKEYLFNDQAEGRRILNIESDIFKVLRDDPSNQDVDGNNIYSYDGDIGDAFSARVYIDSTEFTNKVIVSFRGSESAEEVIGDAIGAADARGDWVGNLLVVLADYVHDQVQAAIQFTKQLKIILNNDPDIVDYDIAFTGHSLGGYLATAISTIEAVDDVTRVPEGGKQNAVAFNPFGSTGTIKQLFGSTISDDVLEDIEGFLLSIIIPPFGIPTEFPFNSTLLPGIVDQGTIPTNPDGSYDESNVRIVYNEFDMARRGNLWDGEIINKASGETEQGENAWGIEESALANYDVAVLNPDGTAVDNQIDPFVFGSIAEGLLSRTGSEVVSRLTRLISGIEDATPAEAAAFAVFSRRAHSIDNMLLTMASAKNDADEAEGKYELTDLLSKVPSFFLAMGTKVSEIEAEDINQTLSNGFVVRSLQLELIEDKMKNGGYDGSVLQQMVDSLKLIAEADLISADNEADRQGKYILQEALSEILIEHTKNVIDSRLDSDASNNIDFVNPFTLTNGVLTVNEDAFNYAGEQRILDDLNSFNRHLEANNTSPFSEFSKSIGEYNKPFDVYSIVSRAASTGDININATDFRRDLIITDKGNDVIYDSATTVTNDAYFGGNGDDTFYGGKGDDFIHGGYGYDSIGQITNQKLTGENLNKPPIIHKDDTGNDLVSYENLPKDQNYKIVVNAALDAFGSKGNSNIFPLIELFEMQVYDVVKYNNSIVGTDKLVGIDKIIGSSGDDQFTGLALTSDPLLLTKEEIATSGILDDYFVGGAGKDVLSGGSGSDVLDGGVGFDTVQYNLNRVDYEFDIYARNPFVKDLLSSTFDNDRDIDSLLNVEEIHFADIKLIWNGNSWIDAATPNLNVAPILIEQLDTIEVMSEGSIDALDGNIANNFFDPDGDVITYSIGLYPTFINGSIQNWIGFSGLNITGTAPDDYTDVFTTTVTARDGNSFGHAVGTVIFEVSPYIDPFPLAPTFDDTILGDSDPANINDIINGSGIPVINGLLMAGVTGNDTIIGSFGDDSILGGGGNDSLSPGNGRFIGVNTVDGGEGDDILQDSFFGVDSLLGGKGNDTIISINGGNTIDGGEGEDLLDSSTILFGRESLSGGTGNDTILAGGGNNTIKAGDGADLITDSTGDNYIVGGDGDDTVNARASSSIDSNNIMDGGDGIDLIDYSNLGTTDFIDVNLLSGVPSIFSGSNIKDVVVNFENVIGTAYNDIITGNYDANELIGGDGNDTINGLFGRDIITGGLGNDHLSGGRGRDIINGGFGNDTIKGGSGSDIIDGGKGIDDISYANAEALIGVVVDLGTGKAIDGFGHRDKIKGFENLNGGARDDNLKGNSGDNVINGLDGNDIINGASGGFDLLHGGFGLDEFRFVKNAGSQDQIWDFDVNNEQINLSSATFNKFNSISELTITQGRVLFFDSAIIHLGDGQTIEIVKVKPSDLSIDNFIFEAGSLLGTNLGDTLVIRGNEFNSNVVIAGRDSLDTLQIIGSTIEGADFAQTTGIDRIEFISDNVHILELSDGVVSSSDNRHMEIDFTGAISPANGALLDGSQVVSGTLDVLGGTGNDTLEGGALSDIFTGGTGNDIFVFKNNAFASDIITDFTVGADKIDLSSASFNFTNGFADLIITQNGSNTVIDLGNGQTTSGQNIILENIDSTTITETDFIGLTIAPSNSAPIVATPIADIASNEDALFSLDISSNFSDADITDILSYSATLADGSPLPSWLGFDSLTGIFSGTPLNADVGSISIKVIADDNNGNGTAEDIFDIVINNVNDAPTLDNPVANQSTLEDEIFNFIVPENTFSDIDAGDVLSVTATLSDGSPLPTWLNYDIATATFSAIPTNNEVGLLDVKLTVTDIAGATAEQIFTLEVVNVNDAPTLDNPITDTTANIGDSFSYIVPASTFSDIDSGDVLTVTATLTDGSGLPAWLSFDANTATFSGTPLESDFGIIDVQLTATDIAGATASDIFSINVESIITGTDFSETLTGGINPDHIIALDGNDSLAGDNGNDILDGGLGKDTISGGAGNDTLTGGENADLFSFSLEAGARDLITDFNIADGDLIDLTDASFVDLNRFADLQLTDTATGVDINLGGDHIISLSGVSSTELTYENFEGILSDDPNQTIVGSFFSDSISGANSEDFVLGLFGNDTITGFDGNDELRGNFGKDELHGGKADDLLHGGFGADILFGELGNDTLKGSFGRDTLIGGAGSDVLIGGKGKDVFKYTDIEDSTLTSQDMIKDFYKTGFSFWIDKIDLSEITSITSINDLAISNDGVNTYINDNNSNFSISLSGNINLGNEDFIF